MVSGSSVNLWDADTGWQLLSVPYTDSVHGAACFLTNINQIALAKGASITLFLDGDKSGYGRLDATVPMVFSADETTDVGRDAGTGVSDEYPTGHNEFTGSVHWVQIDIDENAEDFDHLITPEERWRVAMARQ